MKLKIKKILIYTGIHLLYLFIISLLNYYGLSAKISNIINMVLFALMYFVIGIKVGKKCDKNGYLRGLKYGFILLFLTTIISILYSFSLTWWQLIYYILLLGFIIFGSIIGINKKRN